MSSPHWSYYNPDRFSIAPAISSAPARSSEPGIRPEPVIPSTIPTDPAGLPLAIPEILLLYIYPERAGIPELERDCHSFLGSSGDISIPHSGVSHGHRNVPIQSDNRYTSTPDSSGLRGLPNRTPLRSDPSLPAGPTSPSDTLNCAAPAHLRTTLISSLTSHNTIRHGFHFLHTEHFLDIKIWSKLNSGWQVWITPFIGSIKLPNMSVPFKNVLKTPRLPRVTSGGRHP